MLVRVIRTLRAAPSIGGDRREHRRPRGAGRRARAARAGRRGRPRSCAAARARPAAAWSSCWSRCRRARRCSSPRRITRCSRRRWSSTSRSACAPASADVYVGLVAATLLRAHYPESTRTYLPMRDDLYSGANLFAFLTPQAKRAAEFWVRAEAPAQAALAPRARVRAARAVPVLAAPSRSRRRARADLAGDRRPRAGGAHAVRGGRDRRRPGSGPGARDAHPRATRGPRGA